MPVAREGSLELTVRELRADDAPAVRQLAFPEVDRSPYGAGARSALEAVIGGSDPDSRALIAIQATRAIGVVVYGSIAGAVCTGRLQLVLTHPDSRRRGVATSLVDAAVASLAAGGSRVIFVELPDDPALAEAKRLLLRSRFRIEVRVADYFRDGIDLAILRRDLP